MREGRALVDEADAQVRSYTADQAIGKAAGGPVAEKAREA